MVVYANRLRRTVNLIRLPSRECLKSAAFKRDRELPQAEGWGRGEISETWNWAGSLPSWEQRRGYVLSTGGRAGWCVYRGKGYYFHKRGDQLRRGELLGQRGVVSDLKFYLPAVSGKS